MPGRPRRRWCRQTCSSRGDRGYHTFRIPSIIATPRGTLLAFAEGRHDGAADSGHIDLVARRSTDAGATWSPVQVVGDNGPDAWVNPCAVVDRRTGTLWLFSTQNRAADKEKEITAGSSRAGITVWALEERRRRRDVVEADRDHGEREEAGVDVVCDRSRRRHPDARRPARDPGQPR